MHGQTSCLRFRMSRVQLMLASEAQSLWSASGRSLCQLTRSSKTALGFRLREHARSAALRRPPVRRACDPDFHCLGGRRSGGAGEVGDRKHPRADLPVLRADRRRCNRHRRSCRSRTASSPCNGSRGLAGYGCCPQRWAPGVRRFSRRVSRFQRAAAAECTGAGLAGAAAQPECAFVSGKCVVTPRVPRRRRVPAATAGHSRSLRGSDGAQLRVDAGRGDLPACRAGGGRGIRRDAGRIRRLRPVSSARMRVRGRDASRSRRGDPRQRSTPRSRCEPRGARPRPRRAGNPCRRRSPARDGASARPERVAAAGRGATEDTPPPVGALDFGHLRRVSPISTNFGFERGRPVDRYFIESFLADHAADVRGQCPRGPGERLHAEIRGQRVERARSSACFPTTRRRRSSAISRPARPFPGRRSTAQSSHRCSTCPRPPGGGPDIQRILKPGGVALVTVPGISQVEWSESWHWSFTLLSARQMFSEVFGEANVRARAYGNVLAATSFLWGIAVEELIRRSWTSRP